MHVIGASGRSGSALCRKLLTNGAMPVPIVRDPRRWAATGIALPARVADLGDPKSLRGALQDATHIVCTAHARHAAAVIDVASTTARLVFLGSTRKFTRWPDEHGKGVIAGETAFHASSRAGIMLHPTMIYGATGEDNVQRLAALLRRLPVLPLPAGGRFLVQPIHQDDVTRAILAALARPWTIPQSLVIAGPSPLPYADFVRAIAAAAGLRPPRIVPFPAGPLMAAAALSRFLPLLPTIDPAEIRRLLEDKNFDIAQMICLLGFSPMPLAEGLERTWGRSQIS